MSDARLPTMNDPKPNIILPFSSFLPPIRIPHLNPSPPASPSSQPAFWTITMSTNEKDVFPFSPPAAKMPPLPPVDDLEKLRAVVATKNTSGGISIQFWKQPAENFIKMQILALEEFTAADPVPRPWKAVIKTLLSQKQLVIMSNHYGLRDLLLPPVAERHAYMDDDELTADLMLVYISGYLCTIGMEAPATWIRDMMAPQIDGICKLALRNKRELEQAAAAAAAETARDAAQQPQAPAQPEEEGEPTYRLPDDARAEGTTQEEWQAGMAEAVGGLLAGGFKIHEAQFDMEGTTHYHVVVRMDAMEPVSAVNVDRDAAYKAALDAAAEKLAAQM
ncbi:hypothetical protein ABW21_db0201645 [Orbilia brochopaga]|nr:hypothetical protein ABW21_db0201645 [Drechslerella brochopaga]